MILAHNSLPVPIGVQAELFILERQARLLGLVESRPDLCQFSSTVEGSIRVIKDGREGLIVSSDVNQNEIGRLISRGLDMASHTHPDPHRCFASPSGITVRPPDFDDKIFEGSSEDIFRRLEDIEKQVRAFDPRIKKILKLHFQERKHSKTILNTDGLSSKSTHTAFSLMGEFLAEGPNGIEVGWDVKETRFGKDLTWEDWALNLAKNTVESLGGKPIPTGSYAMMLHPRVGAQLLTLIAQALSAEAVQLDRSFFKNCEGKPVAGALVSMCDDPFLATGVASDSFDDEGTVHEKVDLIEHGVLKNYFYDLRTASRMGKKSNGHGIKASLSSPPRPAPTNIFLASGQTSFDDMLKTHSKVFLVRDVMGLHTADAVTGEFSLGASGHLYENGCPAHAVRGVTISGRIPDLLKNIESVGTEVEWHGSYGAPYLLVSTMNVAGVS